MVIVPTTPGPSEPHLPEPGRWTGVYLHLATQLRTPVLGRRSGAVTGIIGGVQFRPILCPASINP